MGGSRRTLQLSNFELATADTYGMTHSKEELEQALVGADSFRDVLRALGKRINNGNHRATKGLYRKAGVDIPDFPGNYRRESGMRRRIPDEEFLVNGVHRGGVQLRTRMFSMGVPHVCAICGLLPEWQGAKLTLQVDHIDGDSFNNVPTNLRFLCPNCHAQTDTFGRLKTSDRTGMRYNYCTCGVRITKKALNCMDCRVLVMPERFDWPDLESVVALVNKTNFSQAGVSLGISDNAIRKFLRRNGVDVKSKPLVVEV